MNLDNYINREYTLDFNTALNDSWQLFSKTLGIGALGVMIYGVASMLVGQVIGSVTGLQNGYIGISEEMQGVKDLDVLIQVMGDFYRDNLGTIFGSQIIAQLLLILAFPIAGGFMLVCREIDRGGQANINTLFVGFKPHYWSRLILLGIIYFILSKIGLMLFVVPGIYIWVAAVIACPFIMFSDLNAVDALKASVSLVNKNWFTVFKILFVASLFGVVGYLVCFVGRVFTYPFVLVTVYTLYKHIIGFNDNEISEIGVE